MKNLLIDVSIKTMVGQLPLIITKNNEFIKLDIDTIYDSSNDILILPKINSYLNKENILDTYIKTYKAEFNTTNTENIVIGDITSKINIVKDVSHNLLKERYFTGSGSDVKPCDSSVSPEMKLYAHNAGAIGVQVTNGTIKPLSKLITTMLSDINRLKTYISVPATPIDGGGLEPGINIYGAKGALTEPTSFTFEDNLLFATPVLLKRMKLPAYLYNDITSGFLYTYYDYNNYITISDEHTASIKGLPGSIVTIKFNNTKSKAYYRIILSRKDNKFLRVSKDELVRLSLVCTENNDEFGASWDVLNYSVRHADDLIIENKK